jgi:hypothetical protein
MRAWHDYHLTGYKVDGVGHEITFEVSWPYKSSTDIAFAFVVFSEVEGYFFEHDLGANILYSLAEEPLEAFLTEHAKRFEQEAKWGWPLFWRGSAQQTLDHLNAKNIKCFEISSSYGLSGWVLAAKVEHREPEA